MTKAIRRFHQTMQGREKFEGGDTIQLPEEL